MKYYLVKLNSLPKLSFVHTFETGNYIYERQPHFTFFEITYIEAGYFDLTYPNGDKMHINQGSTLVEMPGSQCSLRFISNDDEKIHRHITTGFDVDFTRRVISKDEILDKYAISERNWDVRMGEYEFILPEVLPTSAGSLDVHKSLMKLSAYHCTKDSLVKNQFCTGELFILLSKITESCINEILSQRGSDAKPYNMFYIKKFTRFVETHIAQQITCKDAAKELGITPGYLSKIIGDETGQTPNFRINAMKLKKVVELCSMQGYSFSEAGRLVGFDDVHYLSRLFKKHYGVTFVEYCKREILI